MLQELNKNELIEVPEQDTWRIPYLRKLLAERLSAHYKGDAEEEDRLKELINSLVVN